MTRILFFSGILLLSSANASYVEKKIISVGSGSVVQAKDDVEISYTLWVNDRLIETKKNLRFKLDDKKMIAGLYQAIVGSKRGDKFSFLVPPELGYGKRVEGDIPPNSTLRYELEIN